MDIQTSSEKVKAEADEIFRSWLESVELFFKDQIGEAILHKFPEDEREIVKLVFAAYAQVPKEADPELREAVKRLRESIMVYARTQLQAIFFIHDRDDGDLDKWLSDLRAMAMGNGSAVKSMRLSCVAVSPKPQPSAVPAPDSNNASKSEARPTLPVDLGLPTVPVAYNPESLQTLGLRNSQPPKLEELLVEVPSIPVYVEPEVPTQTRFCAIPPPPQVDDGTPESTQEDKGRPTQPNPIVSDLILDPDFDKGWGGDQE